MDIEEAVVTRDSRLSQRDTVTVTPEEKDQIKDELSLLTPVVPSGGVAGLAKEERAPDVDITAISLGSKEQAAEFVIRLFAVRTLETN
jgi:hypothetical protein